MDKEVLIRNFSKYACIYDRYADVQNLAASRLMEQIGPGGFERILEIGCGTGNFTILLRERFKYSRLKAVDISASMVEVAREKLRDKNIEFITADAERIELDERFDLVCSNACFQWFNDLEKSLVKYGGLLNQNGLILFSVFGPRTFRELDAALKSVLGNGSVEASKFITDKDIGRIARRNFGSFEMEQTEFTQVFADVKTLLEKIKYSGIRGSGLERKTMLGRSFLARLEQAYLDKFKQIRATYQIFFCRLKP